MSVSARYMTKEMWARSRKAQLLREAGDPGQLARDARGAAAMRVAIENVQAAARGERRPFDLKDLPKPGCFDDHSEQPIASDTSGAFTVPVALDKAKAGSVRCPPAVRPDHASDGTQEHEGSRREAAVAKPRPVCQKAASRRVAPARIQLRLHLHRDRPAAILVSRDGVEKHAAWLPRRACHIESAGDMLSVFVPKAMAAERGLI